MTLARIRETFRCSSTCRQIFRPIHQFWYHHIFSIQRLKAKSNRYLHIGVTARHSRYVAIVQTRLRHRLTLYPTSKVFDYRPWASLGDEYGFISIYPNASTLNTDQCWDVSSQQSLTHNGGGDALGIVSMVRWTLEKYHADKDRVFVTGTRFVRSVQYVCETYTDFASSHLQFRRNDDKRAHRKLPRCLCCRKRMGGCTIRMLCWRWLRCLE